ncbi:MAG: argininosuccinate synthase, partial [Aeromonas sobria]
WTVSAEQAPNEPEYVKLTVAQGEVVAVDDQPLTPHQILTTLNERAGKHGVGRIDITENRMVGMKSRGCYETPGGTVMVAALRAVEELVLDRPTRAWREKLGAEFSHLVYDGRWFTPLCKAILASANAIAEDLDGEVILKMYKGQVTAVQKKSPNSLYSEDFATFGADEVYDQSHAEGFIRLYTLASRIRAMKEQHQAIGGDHTHG